MGDKLLDYKGFFDLCLEKTLFERKKYEEIIKEMYDYGYRTIAINHYAEEADEPDKPDKPDEADKDEVKEKSGKKKWKKNIDVEQLVPEAATRKAIKGCEDMKVLNRLTIKFSTSDFFQRIAKDKKFASYDIIGAMPKTQQAYSHLQNSDLVDIVSFPTDRKLSFNFKIDRTGYNQLVRKQISIEFLYSPIILNSTARRNTIALAHSCFMLGKSRNVIISSGADCVSLIRSPYDTLHLGLIFGLSENQTKAATNQLCRQTCIRALGRCMGKVPCVIENLTDLTLNQKKNKAPNDEEDGKQDGVVQPSLKKIKS